VVFESVYRRRAARAAGLIFGSVAVCVLLLACANVAAILLARAEERRYEMAVRGAIGGARGRLLRQLLIENALLAVLSGAAGLFVAWLTVRSLPAMIPPSPLPLALVFRIDSRVFAAAAILAAATIVTFGLAPALTGSRADPGILLKSHSPAAGAGGSRVRRAIVTGQLALSFALLTTSVLLVRSVHALDGIDPGFSVRPMLIVAVSPGAAGYSQQAGRAYYRSAMERLRALSGIERVGLVKRPPLSLYGGGATELVNVQGHDAPAGEPGFRVHFNVVAPGYFETMGGGLVRGRDFDASDTAERERVAIVSETMARRFWHDADVIGEHMRIGENQTVCRIVGIARDGKYNSLTETADAYLYLPLSQRYTGEAAFLVRTHGDERAAIAAVRAELAAIDRSIPALQIMTIGNQLRLATFVERTTAALVTGLGALCLFLSIVGLYGLASYVARRSTREIAVRVALGARPRDVVYRLLLQLRWPVACGIGGGLVFSFLLARLTASSMYGVSATDVTTYAASASMLVTVILIALVGPARRAARTDPASVLRAE
jgi:predicted permease